jgi:hypothetical protein
MTDEFDWSDAEDDTILETVGAIAVYANPRGDAVIRQQGVNYDIGQDAVVVVPIEHVDRLIKKLESVISDLKGTE